MSLRPVRPLPPRAHALGVAVRGVDRAHGLDRVGLVRRACPAGSPSRARSGARRRPGSACSSARRRTRSRRRAPAARSTVWPSRCVSSSWSRSVCHASSSSVMPLNVFPSITNAAALRIARAEVEVREPALAPAVAPLRREHDEVERVRDLDLEPAGAAPARLVRRVERLDHHALVPARERVLEERAAPRPTSAGLDPRHAQLLRDPLLERGEPLARRRGRSDPRRRGGARRRRTARAAPACAAPSTFTLLPKRLIVCWKRRGRPFAVERDRLAVEHDRLDLERAHGLDDLGDAIGDVGEVPRERAHLVPRACTWMRAPSSFHSTDAGLMRASASSRSSPVCASIGWIGLSTVEPEAGQPVRALADRGGRHRRRARRRASTARRTCAAGMPAAFATASTMTPSSAPWRSSPRKSPTRNRCSASVARPKSAASSSRRAACEPRPGDARRSATRPRRRRAARSVGGGAPARGAGGAPPSRRRSSPAAARPRGRRPRRQPPPGAPARDTSASRDDLREPRRRRRDVGGSVRDLGEQHSVSRSPRRPTACTRAAPRGPSRRRSRARAPCRRRARRTCARGCPARAA